ncbi:helix-hairpin-helix domain-containing protein [Sphingobacterium hungaricum]|uniref:Competence protein ComEA n=1 Tax=Sphingobacterium hungaricum TaxID=2082723 RepID=A0A928V1Q3_9SPHI|nr:helix-hairpin-helix domain-containing protein [Sphingobacterium hungaricum]MBE8715044.1 competence protein ComEA [Sphingobacterium hungaricum]
MKRFFEFFSITRSERNGFYVLFCIILLLIFIPVLYQKFTPKSNPSYTLVEFPEEEKNDFRYADSKNHYDYSKRESTAKNNHVTYFPFNPNNLPDSSWLKLGLTPRQIAVIKNYEKKGGKFYKKEDLAKIYSISEKDYARLEPYINIPSKNSEVPIPDKKIEVYPSKSSTVRIDINSADTTDWKQLKGIGSSYAKRIVNYRIALGGFYKVEQLKEVYGLPEELYQQIYPQLFVGNTGVSKININSADLDMLKKHPYISNKEAQLLVSYRTQHGDYKSMDDLRKILAINENFFLKIEPYLAF